MGAASHGVVIERSGRREGDLERLAPQGLPSGSRVR